MVSIRNLACSDSDQEPLLEKAQVRWKELGEFGVDSWEELGFSELNHSDEYHYLEKLALEEFEGLQKAYKELEDALRKNWGEFRKEAYDAKYEKLLTLKDIWSRITPQKFVVTVSLLGTDSKEYLKLLSFPLDADDWLVEAEKKDETDEWKWLKNAKLERAYQVYQSLPKDFPTYDSVIKSNKEAEEKVNTGQLDEPWPGQGSFWYRFCQNHFTAYFLNPPKVSHAVHWTAVTQLLVNSHTNSTVRMIKALHNCGDGSEAFNTIVSRTIANNAWEKVKWLFYWRLVQDVLFLVCLGILSAYIVFWTHTQPPWKWRLVVAVLGVRSILIPTLELIQMLCLYGVMEGLNNLFTFWNTFIVGSELMCAFLIIWLMFLKPKEWEFWYSLHYEETKKCNYDDVQESECSVIIHPVAFAVSILLKWTHCTFEMMCMWPLGQTVLPAFYAAIGKETLWFLCFLGFVLAGSFQSYWSLPIPDNLPAKGRSHIEKIFLKIFRMDVLGQVDLSDMEGVDEEITVTRNGTGYIREGHENLLYHDAILVLIVFLSLTVAIFIMNVLIGIVSQAYEHNKSNANQIWCHYRAPYVTKLLVRRKFWKTIASRIPVVKNIQKYFVSAVDPTDYTREMKGIFIGCHEAFFLDANDTKEDLVQIISQENAVKEQLDIMNAKMEEKMVVNRQEFEAFQEERRKRGSARSSTDSAPAAEPAAGPAATSAPRSRANNQDSNEPDDRGVSGCAFWQS